MKRKVRLSESQLHRIIKESVKRVLRESNETTVFGLPLSIISDSGNIITIQYNGNEYTIDKKGDFDSTTRYIYLGDKYYDNIGFKVTDGYAVCDGDYSDSKMVDTNTEYFGKLADIDNSKDDIIEAYFPKLRDILTNEDMIEDCLYYFAELYDGGEGENILERYLKSEWHNNVEHFFEGLFFGGSRYIIWKINGEEV